MGRCNLVMAKGQQGCDSEGNPTADLKGSGFHRVPLGNAGGK